MKSILLKAYQIEKDVRNNFLDNLSDEEFETLLDEFKECTKTIGELQILIKKIYDYNKKYDSISYKISWLFNKKAKKEFEDAWRATSSELETKIEAIKGSYIWDLLDIEMDAYIAENPYFKKEDNHVRAVATINLSGNLKEIISYLSNEE